MVYHMISSLILDGNQLTISIYFNGIYIYILILDGNQLLNMILKPSNMETWWVQNSWFGGLIGLLVVFHPTSIVFWLEVSLPGGAWSKAFEVPTGRILFTGGLNSKATSIPNASFPLIFGNGLTPMIPQMMTNVWSFSELERFFFERRLDLAP